MVFTKALLLKCLAAVTAVTGTSLGISYRENISDLWSEITRKEKEEINKKIKALALPTTCEFNEKKSTKECELSEEDLEKVIFSNRGSNAKTTVMKLDNGKKIKLEIKKEKGDLPDSLKFTFKDIPTAEKITLMGQTHWLGMELNVNEETEFRIVEDNKLEKVFNLSFLAKEVGLTCADSSCSPIGGATQLKFSNDGTAVIKISVPDTEKNKKITVASGVKGYNQGFKFTVPEGGILGNVSGNNLEAGNYEIKHINGEGKGWSLNKKV